MRNSNFELLRLVAMFFIVFYHILCFVIVKVDDSLIYRALWLPLHVAVICFVLISGYFHIKPSLRGIAKLIAPLVIYYLPLTIWELAHGIGDIKSLFIFSKSPYWFIRTYLCLFLIAPMLNAYLSSNRRRMYLLFILGFISLYMGTLGEPSLRGGKNLALFMFLYVLGDSLRIYKSAYEKYSLKLLIPLWFLLNAALVCCYMLCSETIVGKVLWAMCFPYCSPILIINAVLLFLIFAKMDFKSRYINWLSSSCFAVYIIHHQHLVLYSGIGVLALWGYRELCSSSPFLLLYLGGVTLLVMLGSILIDKVLTPLLLDPLYRFTNWVENKLQ